MILLQATNISRHFGSDVLFDSVSLTIQEHSRVALVGRNGTGKSTLLKMLAGIDAPSTGSISKKRNLSIGYLDQYASIESTQTIWEEMVSLFTDIEQLKKEALAVAEQLAQPAILANEPLYQQTLKRYDTLQELLLQKNAYGYEAEIRTVLHGFHFYPEDYQKSIQQLSGGQRTRLALAKILLEKHDVLILDEPTNHLDIETLTWLENYLSSSTIALLIVSHDQYFLDRICNEVYELHHHRCDYYKGNYSHYLMEREHRRMLQQKAYDKQQAEIQKLEDFIAKNIVRSSTTKRAQSRRKQLEKMQRIEKPKNDERSARFSFSTEHESGNQVLQVSDAFIGYDHTVLSGPIHLQIRKQDAIAIVGPNGVGKSTFLKTLINQIPLISGEMTYGTNVQIGYYDQNLTTLSSNSTVLEELWSRHTTMPEKDIRSILGSFLFSGQDVEKTIGQLSGGEKARLTLAKLALEHDNLLLLDEPTNHLDIDSKEVLEQALVEFDGTLCFVSHDRYFINQVATAILEITPTGSHLYLGDYDYYLEKKKEQEQEKEQQQLSTSSSDNALSKTKQQYFSSKEEQKQIRSLSRKVEQLEEILQELEEKIATIHEELTLEAVYTDRERSATLQQLLAETTLRYEETMQEWEKNSLLLEEATS